MSNKKQTAVEWLIKKITNRQNGVFDGLPHLSLDEIFEQAKELEKQQIEVAYIKGIEESQEALTQEESNINEYMANEYYKQTYGE